LAYEERGRQIGKSLPFNTYEISEYYTVLSGVDSNLNGDSAPDRTIVNPAAQRAPAAGVIGGIRLPGDSVPTASASLVNNVVAWVATKPNARYIGAGPGAYANGGATRNRPGRSTTSICPS